MKSKPQWFVGDDTDVVIGPDPDDENKGWLTKKAAIAWAKRNLKRKYEVFDGTTQ